MTRYFLSQVSIEGLRGINNEGQPLVVGFKTDAVNSVFAHNGAGKSSVFEAIQYAVTGSIRKLDALHHDERGGDYYLNKFHSRQEGTITLTLEPDDATPPVAVTVVRRADGSRTTSSPSHPDPDALLKSLDQELVFLDYHSFRRFVDDSPLARGRSFAGLLGLGWVSEMRQVLEVLSNTGSLDRDFGVTALQLELQSAKSQGQAANTAILNAYRSLFGRDTSTPPDAEAVAVEVLNHLKSAPTIGPGVVAAVLDEVDFPALSKLIETAENGPEQRELVKSRSDLVSLEALAAQDLSVEREQLEHVARLLKARDELVSATAGAVFKRMFEGVQAAIGSLPDPATRQCPVCGTVVIEPIAHIVTKHLEQFSDVERATGELRTAVDAATCIDRLTRLETSRLIRLDQPSQSASALQLAAEHGVLTSDHLESVKGALEALEVRRSGLVQTLTNRIAELEKTLPPSMVALTQRLGFASEIRQAIRTRRAARSTYAAAKRKLDARSRWKAFVALARAQFGVLEAAVIEARSSQIQATCKDLFSAIMNVPEVVPNLQRSENSQALSLQLEEFYGLADLGAVPLLSESFRNAFAMAVFLSSAVTIQPRARFMILDDVTSSFDGGHQFRLLDAVRTRVARPDNASGPQVILLSHDGLLEKYFDVLNAQPGWVHTKITSTAPVGRIDAPALTADRLKTMITDHLRNGRVDDAARLVRPYLEFTLQQIIRKVGIRVPFDLAIRENVRLPGDCVESILKDIVLHEAANRLVLAPQQVADARQIATTGSLANWLSHYSSATLVPLTPGVVRGIIDEIDKFADCFKYDCQCDGSPKRRWYKSLEAKCCSC